MGKVKRVAWNSSDCSKHREGVESGRGECLNLVCGHFSGPAGGALGMRTSGLAPLG